MALNAFGLAVLGLIIGSCYFYYVKYGFYSVPGFTRSSYLYDMRTFDWGLLFNWGSVIGVALSVCIAGGISLHACFLGARILLRIAGAHEINHNSNPGFFNIVTIVEEMTIASGLQTMPRVFIIDTDGLNAFSVGRPKGSVIAVTSGLLKHLSRVELQGVIGHEIAHIRNEDSRFMTFALALKGTNMLVSYLVGLIPRLIRVLILNIEDIVLFACVVLPFTMLFIVIFYAGIFQVKLEVVGDAFKPILFLILAAPVGAYVAVVYFPLHTLLAALVTFLGPLPVQYFFYAGSREREFLADASSALFNHYPEGLASALEKIELAGNRVVRVNRLITPMLIVNPLRALSRRTHPSTAERVRILRSMTRVGIGAYQKSYIDIYGTPLVGIRTGADQREREPLPNKERELAHARQSGGGTFLLFRCVCGTRLRILPLHAGKKVRCPRCSAVSRVRPPLPNAE
jgi:heat shock protein HtpX